MASPVQPTWLPGRPPNVLDVERTLNGSPQPLGILTSTGTAVNNVTTATPFAQTPRGPQATAAVDVPANLADTLAGRTLLVSATAAGFLLPSTSASIGVPTVTTVATTATIPPAANTFPGVPIAAGEVKLLIMRATEGWLQFISSSGTASLVVWELV